MPTCVLIAIMRGSKMNLEHETIGPEVAFCQYRACIQPASVETLDGPKVCPKCLENTVLTWMYRSWPRDTVDEPRYQQASHFALCKMVKLGQQGGMMVKDFNAMWSRILGRCAYLIARYGNCQEVIHKLSTGFQQGWPDYEGP